MEEFILKCHNHLLLKNKIHRVYLHSFGCVQNVSDGENILGILSEIGYEITFLLENADLIIYNTCAIRESAEKKVYGLIGELKHLKDKNPDIIIGICGCMANEEHNIERIKKTYKQVDFAVGTRSIKMLPKILSEVLSKRNFAFDNDERSDYLFKTNPVRSSNFKASVPIILGCDNFCSYCIVPYVRGREVSRPFEDILLEVKTLAENGCKEITLVGQNVNSYGKNLENPITFSELLRRINEIDGDFKIRFISPHPKDVTTELIDTILSCDKICKHIHLPLQSGSDNILSLMNRKYNAEKYNQIVDYIREKSPLFSISTDIIVGFPNESDEDFAKTMEIISRTKFSNVFSFIYSVRKGTKAAEMVDLTPAADKTKRMSLLLETQSDISTEYNNSFVGKNVEVLLDSIDKNGFLVGKSDEFITVKTSCTDEKLIGERQIIKITNAQNKCLCGNIL